MPSDQEIYSLEEITRSFDAKRIGVSGAFFDTHKLDWINQQYLINSVPENQLWQRMKEWSFNDTFMQKLMPMCHTRIKTFGEFIELCGFLFVNHLHITPEELCPLGQSKEKSAGILQALIWDMDAQENWKKEGIESASHSVAQTFGVHHKKVIIPILYIALTGKRHGPPIFEAIDFLGKDRARARLLNAIEVLGGISNKKMDLLSKGWAIKNCREIT